MHPCSCGGINVHPHLCEMLRECPFYRNDEVMAVKRNIRSCTLFFAIVFILGVFVSACQGYPVTDSSSPDGFVYEWIDITSTGTSIFPSSNDYSVEVPVPEFPTLAVPAGLLVGMIYIVFLLMHKGKNHRSVQNKKD